MTRSEMLRLGWDELDVLLVTGDAYVDHPSFGVALLGRLLAREGFRVGVVSQPRWETAEEVARLGRPRLFAGVTAGALDSMLAHYTAFRRKRRDDAYTPGGRAGARPNRATIVYTNLLQRAFPRLPVVLGGIEASLRRVTHYDFWSDRLRRSILLDSKATLLLYGMAERGILELATRLRDLPGRDDPLEALRGVPGSVFVGRESQIPADAPRIHLPAHEEIEEEPTLLMRATLALERQVHDGTSWALQRVGERTVVLAPPPAPLSPDELDRLYELPFTRQAHPAHGTRVVPAAEMIRFSITTHRGCGGGCSFCSLALHQGRRVRSRSAASIRGEAATLTRHPLFAGSISDVGGPSANMWGARCRADHEACQRQSCLFPGVCESFCVSQREIVDLLRSIARLDRVKHLRVASGIRHDLALDDPDYLRALVGEFTGGQLKLAPEHCCSHVLELMRKPPFDRFERFLTLFERTSSQAGKEQYVVPYLMSAFPGCTEREMHELSRWLRRRGWRPRQVQCFIPTPGTVATAIYLIGVDTRGRPVHVARSDAERRRQHRILMTNSGS
jgi:uncharacterized radical SAM protein YgiQ